MKPGQLFPVSIQALRWLVETGADNYIIFYLTGFAPGNIDGHD